MRYEHQVNGVIELPPEKSFDEFWTKFIEFIESNGGTFGGGYTRLDENGNAIAE